jgi:hypothetical protein
MVIATHDTTYYLIFAGNIGGGRKKILRLFGNF